jgi:hypothetical protein
MKTRHAVLATISLLLLGRVALADRQLDRAEVLDIFKTLTSQPTTTWIDSGTIKAAHEEYRAPQTTDENQINSQIQQEIQKYQSSNDKQELTAERQKMKLDAIPFNVRYELSNEYTMNSTVLVEYDGNRFNWEISVTSRKDSVTPGPELSGNFMTNDFNLRWNGKRAFTWDGGKYTIYSRSANYSLVDTAGSLPHFVNGPLTAGVVPWGNGDLTYDNLSATEATAEEKDVNGQAQIHLTMKLSDGSQMLLVMDPARAYALISTMLEGDDTTISTNYGNYQQVSGRWVPRAISIEQSDRWTGKLQGYDIWNLTSISGSTPVISSFSVAYEPDAKIEYHSPISDRALTYSYSPMLDMETLLAERLDFMASEGTQVQNCATASFKYAASQLGKGVSNAQLARLIDGPGGTSLEAMKDLAVNLGLYARAVRTDVKGLSNLDGCQAILHLPGKNHYVALGDIDSTSVWCVDVASDKFCYQANIHFFGMDWTEGTALLISDHPIRGDFDDIADSELRAIRGGSGYECSDLLQEDDVYFCSYFCDGYYEYYPERWGCAASDSGMCMMSDMLRCAQAVCLIKNTLGDCRVSADWTLYYMMACS